MKQLRVFWRPFLCGVCVGGLGILPGVSGGALAASFGYYELLLFAAAHPIKGLKEKGNLLLPFVFGIGGGILLLGRALLWLFEVFPTEVRFGVAGLIVGTLFCSAKEVFDNPRRVRQIVLAAAFFGVGLALFYGNGLIKIGIKPTFCEWMLCGGVYALGTVVPGVSATCLLLSMDAYAQVLSLIAGKNLFALLPFLVGFAGVSAGLVCIVNCLYRQCNHGMSAVIFGFVAASVFPVIPPISPDKSGVVSLCCGLFGLALVCVAEGKVNRKAKKLYSSN